MLGVKKILITGGCGFIGSSLIKHLIDHYPNYLIYNIDNLESTSQQESLQVVENSPSYTFIEGDINDFLCVNKVFEQYDFDYVIHLAESHIDRSREDPLAFINTNIAGTVNLLNAAKDNWKSKLNPLFLFLSSDKVYGSLDGKEEVSNEQSSYNPTSPYAASKASANLLVKAFGDTYAIPYIIANASNTFGPFQLPNKLIPVIIQKIKNRETIPIYGDGSFSCDWIWIKDHVEAIVKLLHKGKRNETYIIGANQEMRNLDLVLLLCHLMEERLGRSKGETEKLFNFVKTEKNISVRSATNSDKLMKDTGWQPTIDISSALEQTIDWYLDNEEWIHDKQN